jgi:hypothetical protein
VCVSVFLCLHTFVHLFIYPAYLLRWPVTVTFIESINKELVSLEIYARYINAVVFSGSPGAGCHEQILKAIECRYKDYDSNAAIFHV